MSGLYLYDDARARTFEPFALTRPTSELRAGTALGRERWEHALGVRADGALVAPHLYDFEEAGAPLAVLHAPAGAILANSRCAVALAALADEADLWTCGGRVAAVRLASALTVDDLAHGDVPLEAVRAAGTRVAEISGRWIDEVWDLLSTLGAQLREDIAAIGPTLDCVPANGAIVIGSHPVYVERGAGIEPQVCFDVTGGPVLVRAGAHVRAFTRVGGPCWIGAGSAILGDRVQGCAIGEGSRIRGEMSETIVVGNANKVHDGFIGNSYLGRWVNLGAGTTTSNLKNTYGAVALWTPSGIRDTGVLNIGTLFGDHVKTGIGMRLTTGSVIGAGSNIYGSAMPPKFVPPFSWGEGDALGSYRLDKFLQTAERAMMRRQVELGARARAQLSEAHARAQRVPR